MLWIFISFWLVFILPLVVSAAIGERPIFIHITSKPFKKNLLLALYTFVFNSLIYISCVPTNFQFNLFSSFGANRPYRWIQTQNRDWIYFFFRFEAWNPKITYFNIKMYTYRYLFFLIVPPKWVSVHVTSELFLVVFGITRKSLCSKTKSKR